VEYEILKRHHENLKMEHSWCVRVCKNISVQHDWRVPVCIHVVASPQVVLIMQSVAARLFSKEAVEGLNAFRTVSLNTLKDSVRVCV